MRRSTLVATALLVAASLVATAAEAAWQVDNGQSSFTFVTTKAGAPGTSAIEEVQSFRQISGTVGDDGALQFAVDLASVETNIPLRNDRIKQMLFKVSEHPQAVFTGSVDVHRLDALPPGGSDDVDVSGTLVIAGQSNPVAAHLRVVKLERHALLVTTRTPIIVNLKDYGLQDGVEALRSVMNLNVLSGSAPVSFSVMLHADH
ncbi:YceI family protein [Paraburkholderia oxyphila]|uniref:YceI family protein n=1 Tax=Paraburkholderia oxyphila TaxID=614212 RepID=UPI0005BAF430|nr:YceI family protein [Paraburkholderia oxyphila]